MAKKPRRAPRAKKIAPDLGTDRWGDEQGASRPNDERALFTPGEMGQPDQTRGPGARNPQGAQGDRGPLGQEGQGNRQNDELDELNALTDRDVEDDLRERGL